MSLFSLEQLFFAYPQDPDILQEVSFSFFPEEKIGFYGPNGCGKSTLFRLIMGLLQPKRGHICFQGKSLETEKEFRTLRREVGLVLQNADDQLFHPTVLEDIAFGPLNLGLKAAAARERAMDTLKQLGLSHLYTSLTHRLSGGEKRLVALASVLSMQPKALLLDEPTNDLDPTHRARLIRILQDLPAGKIIISHDFDFLQQTCTSFMSIHEQKIVRGKTLHLHQHVHAHLLGEAPHSHM